MIVNQSLFEWSINKKLFLSLSFVNFREIKCPKFIIFCKIAKIIARKIFGFQIREIKCPGKLVRIRYYYKTDQLRGSPCLGRQQYELGLPMVLRSLSLDGTDSP